MKGPTDFKLGYIPCGNEQVEIFDVFCLLGHKVVPKNVMRNSPPQQSA